MAKPLEGGFLARSMDGEIPAEPPTRLRLALQKVASSSDVSQSRSNRKQSIIHVDGAHRSAAPLPMERNDLGDAELA